MANVTKEEISGKLDSRKIRVGKVIKLRIRLGKEYRILCMRTEHREEREGTESSDF